MSRRHRPHYPHRLIMTATRTEVRRNNAASRSLEWIERAIARNDASTLQAWTAVFSVAADPNAVRSVVRGLATLMGELESVEKFAVVSNIPADQWRAQIDAAMSGIGVANLHANWAGNKQAMTTASVPLALRWLAQAMPDEGAVDVASDEVIALRADLISLRERIATSELTAELRGVLYRAIDEMLRSIDEAPIAGMRAVREHSFELYAILTNEAETFDRAQDEEEVRAFTSLVVRFYTWAPKIERAMAFASNLLQVLQGGTTIYRSMHPAGPPPLLENPAPRGHT